MGIRAITRRALHSAVRLFAGKTLFSDNKKVRSVGFDVLSQHQRLICCARADGEAFVVRAGDHYIGRGLFVDGEFDFGKFVAAFDALLTLRPDRRPKVLIDVGANVGSICIPAVTRGYFGRAVAIEPDPLNARLLRANIALNGLDARIRTAETAAGARDGEVLELERSGENFGDHRIRVSSDNGAHDEASREIVRVPSAMLDSICREEERDEALVWMDVQGFEGIALAGAPSFLARRTPMVLEFCPYLMRRAQSFAALKHALADYAGFVDLEKRTGLRPIAELQALYDGLGKGQAFTDILVL